MGLDVVDIVLEAEESFDIDLEDWKLGQMRTVGDLFELVCEQLQLPFGNDAPRPTVVSIPLSIAPAGDWRPWGWPRAWRLPGAGRRAAG